MITWSLSLNLALAAFAVQGPMTLEDAIREAESRAFNVRSASANLEKSRQRVREAKGLLGPKATGSASYTRYADKVFNGSSFSNESKAAQLSVSMPFDIFGITKKGIKSTQLSSDAAKDTLQAARNDLALSVKRAYFGVLQAESQVQVTVEAKGEAEERLKNARAQLEAGQIAKLDVLRLETALAQASNEVLVAENARDLAKNAFNNALARPIETPVALASITEIPMVGTADEEMIGFARKQRPELHALRDTIEALKFVRITQEGGMTPSLSLSATHSRTFNPGLTTNNRQTFGTLALSVPIFDSGVTRARVKQARQDEELAKIQLDQAELAISLEVRQATVNYRNARQRLEVAAKQVEVAAETYRLAKIRFEAGEGIPLEITDAQTELTRARTNEVTARYDVLRAYAELQRAVGSNEPNKRAGE